MAKEKEVSLLSKNIFNFIETVYSLKKIGQYSGLQTILIDKKFALKMIFLDKTEIFDPIMGLHPVRALEIAWQVVSSQYMDFSKNEIVSIMFIRCGKTAIVLKAINGHQLTLIFDNDEKLIAQELT